MRRVMAVILAVAVVSMSGYAASNKVQTEGDTAIGFLTDKGILSGYENGDVKADALITRAELCKMLVLAKGEKAEGECSFPDVAKSHWAYHYIAAASRLGFVNGYEDGTFLPDNHVTYEEAIKMVLSAYGYAGAYPLGYINYANEHGYLDGILAVISDYAARGEVAKLIYHAMQIGQNEEETEQIMGIKGIGGGSGGSSVRAAYAPSVSSLAVSGVQDGIYLPEEPVMEELPDYNTEEYQSNDENGMKDAKTSPLSTFSVDVDTASYSNMRRFLLNGSLPQKGAVRIEELINYFDYDLPAPTDGTPVSVSSEVYSCPWNSGNLLAMVSLKGEEYAKEDMPPSNLVFLLDTSGSMYSDQKLPLVKKAMTMLVEQLRPQDKISIVTYAGSAGVVVEGCGADQKETILGALDSLQAGGSTAGGEGIELAYSVAERYKMEGNNRVILCTDGDFNVGISSTAELEDFITKKREKGISLSVLGFGMGNYKDNRMETLADKGNGNYAYIDNEREAKKVLVDDMTATLYTIAKDVKLQIEFNPALVRSYRLIGYENRKLENEDFANDKKDAGEMGAGHSVTAFYELVPNNGEAPSEAVDGLKYQQSQLLPSDELFQIKVRYKEPEEEESKLIETSVRPTEGEGTPSERFRFAAAVAQLGMILNESEYQANSSYDTVLNLATEAIGSDGYGLRAEFVQLVGIARYLERQPIGNH